MNPFFSIIVPLFNGAATLPLLLDSITMQHCRDFEVIFMDGASTDNSLALITEFQEIHQDCPVMVCSEKDKGIYDAMNKGIGKATGDWIYFLGSDDRFCHADVLKVVKKELENVDADLIYGNVQGVASGTRYVYDTTAKVLSRGIHHQSAFYRQSLFNSLGMYDLGYRSAADYDFTLKIFFKGSYKIRYINTDIAYYGEAGFSTNNFDYKFFSGHYRLLALHHAIDKTEDPGKCLSDSVYCCYHLARHKKEVAVAWRNMIFYLFRVRSGSLYFRLKMFLNMFKWTVWYP